MRFLVDECTGPAVANWLRSQSHEVFSVYDEARGIGDDEIITKAAAENWILITNDKDFGEKIFREKRAHCGTILLRLDDERAPSKIAAIEKLLQLKAVLANRFVVVTERRVRFAGITAKRRLPVLSKLPSRVRGCEPSWPSNIHIGLQSSELPIAVGRRPKRWGGHPPKSPCYGSILRQNGTVIATRHTSCVYANEGRYFGSFQLNVAEMVRARIVAVAAKDQVVWGESK